MQKHIFIFHILVTQTELTFRMQKNAKGSKAFSHNINYRYTNGYIELESEDDGLTSKSRYVSELSNSYNDFDKTVSLLRTELIFIILIDFFSLCPFLLIFL